MCKLFISTLISLRTPCVETYEILHPNQEGFCRMRNTTRQLQAIIQIHKQRYIYHKLIWKNAFGLTNHARLLAIMIDLGYPPDAVELMGNIYSLYHIFQRYLIHTHPPIPITQGILQGDTPSSYIFQVF